MKTPILETERLLLREIHSTDCNLYDFQKDMEN